MKKIIAALFVLCFSSSAFAINPLGTGWSNGMCPTKYKDADGQFIMKRCKIAGFNKFGVQIDMGFPNALGLSFVALPVKFLQFDLGGTTTLIGGGVRAGVLLFLPWYISPGLSIDGGKQWAGNVNNLINMFAANPNQTLLTNIQYTYTDFYGSVGFGHPSHFMFRLYAGYSYISGSTNGLQLYFQDKANDKTITTKEAEVKGWVPSAKIGFNVFF